MNLKKLNDSHIETYFDVDNMQSVYLEIERVEKTRTSIVVDVTKEHAEQLKDKNSYASRVMIELLKDAEPRLDEHEPNLLEDCITRNEIKHSLEYKMKHTDINHDKKKVMFVDYDVNELVFDEKSNTFDFVQLAQEQYM